MVWNAINDSKVRLVWQDGEQELTTTIEEFMEFGNPIDSETGDDLVHIRTEINQAD